MASTGLLPLILLSQGALAYNATTDYNDVACVYPISGAYGLLNRILFYVLWSVVATVVLTRSKWTWAAIGSMAWIMAYSATASVHAFVLAVSVNYGNPQYDLDAVGAWCIVSIASLGSLPIMWYSSRLRESVYRPIFAFWTTLVLVGAACSVSAMFKEYPYPVEPQCMTNDFNCTYSCLRTKQILRNPAEMEIVLARRLYDGVLQSLLIAAVCLGLIVGSSFGIGIFACCMAGDRKRTKAELERTLDRKALSYETAKMRRQRQQAKAHARKELKQGKYVQTQNFCLVLNPVVFPIVIAFNETYVRAKGGLPTSESPYAVGQWGSWVTVGFGLIAACLNAYYGPRWNKLKETLDAEREEFLAERKKPPSIRVVFQGEKTDDVAQWAERTSREVKEVSSSQLYPKPPSPCAFRPYSPIPVTPPSVDTPPSGSQQASQEFSQGGFSGKGPFKVGDITKMPILRYDGPCEAYDDWGPEYNNHIIRDGNGKHWAVYKGVLFNRELWRA